MPSICGFSRRCPSPAAADESIRSPAALLLFLALASSFACSEGSETPDGGGDAGAADSGYAAVFVREGKALDVRMDGDAWTSKAGVLVSGGCYNFLTAGKKVGTGDFRVSIRMRLNRAEGARLVLNGNNHLIMKDSDGLLAVEGPAFENGYVQLGVSPVSANTFFRLDLVRRGDRVSFLLDGSEIYGFAYDMPEPVTVGVTPSLGDGLVGICTSDTVMSISDFSAEGPLKPLTPAPALQDVYKQGDDGIAAYRIPAIVMTKSGVLLAFSEGRKSGISDNGDISLVMKRSLDGGASWGPMQLLAGDGVNTHGNPVPILDRDTGTVWLVFNIADGSLNEAEINAGKGTRDVWVMHSTDEGQSWSDPIRISDAVKGPGWRWVAQGPGHGIQTSDGRMVVPGNFTVGPTPQDGFSYVCYSDDHGATWKLGGTVPGAYGDEASAAEKRDSSLLVNFRTKSGTYRRWVSASADKGATWAVPKPDPELIEPVCEGSILRLYSQPWDSLSGNGGTMIFSNPASTRRELMSIHASFDGAGTWPVFNWIYPGPSAYSDVVELGDGSIGVLFERGRQTPYETITFTKLTGEWILQ